MKKIIFLTFIFCVLAIGQTTYAAEKCFCVTKLAGQDAQSSHDVTSENLECIDKQILGKVYSGCQKKSEPDSSGASGGSGNAAKTGGGSAAPSVGGGGVDMRCWTKDKCESKEVEGKLYGPNDETRRACGSGQDAKKQPIGFCLPPYSATTQIDFGGTKTFDNIGVFIKYLYRYAIISAGILAVVMIIVAGFQWATSGGNSERISSAKKRISGAMMGLFLAVLSYAVLANLNPYLVNLRLPQAWLINEQKLTPMYCDELKDNAKVIFASEQGKEPSNEDKKSKGINGDYEKGTEVMKAECGKNYFVEKSGALTCIGTKCNGAGGSPSVCVNYLSKDKNKPFNCTDTMLAGSITRGDIFDLSESIADNVELLAACNNGDINPVDNKSVTIVTKGKFEYFQIPYSTKIDSICEDDGGVAGFYLGVQVNDETGGLGMPGTKLTYGIDDYFAIGQVGENSHSCIVNLSKTAYLYKNGKYPACQSFECTCSYISPDPFLEELCKQPNFKNHLISLEELKRGYNCSIVINRSEFSAADNSSIKFDLKTLGELYGISATAPLPPVYLYLMGQKLFGDPTKCQSMQKIW